MTDTAVVEKLISRQYLGSIYWLIKRLCNLWVRNMYSAETIIFTRPSGYVGKKLVYLFPFSLLSITGMSVNAERERKMWILPSKIWSLGGQANISNRKPEQLGGKRSQPGFLESNQKQASLAFQTIVRLRGREALRGFQKRVLIWVSCPPSFLLQLPLC